MLEDIEAVSIEGFFYILNYIYESLSQSLPDSAIEKIIGLD
jgi:hypothetical protein